MLPALTFGQSYVDSLTQALPTAPDSSRAFILRELFWENLYQDAPRAITYAQQLLDFAQPRHDTFEVARAHHLLGMGHFYNTRLIDANRHLLTALDLRQQIHDTMGISYTYGALGMVSDNLSDYPTALDYYFQALDVLGDKAQPDDYAKTYTNLGIIYKKQGDFPLAKSYLQKSIALHADNHDSVGVATAQVNLGILYKDEDQLDSALYYHTQSLQFFEAQNFTRGVAICIHNLGVVDCKRKDYDAALAKFRHSMQLGEELHSDELRLNNLNEMARTYRDAGKYVHAIRHAEQGYALAQQMGIKKEGRELCALLAEAHAALGHYSQAYQYQAAQLALHDSIFSEDKSREIGRLEARFEAQAQARTQAAERTLLEKEKALQTAELQRQRTLAYSLGAGLVMLIVLVYVLFRYSRRQRGQNETLIRQQQAILEKNQQLEQQQHEIVRQREALAESNVTKDKFLSILAHDIRGPITTLTSFTNLLAQYAASMSPDELNELSLEAHRSTQNLQALVDNLLKWAQSQSNRMTYQRQPFFLEPVLATSIEHLRSVAHQKQITVTLRDDGDACVLGDIPSLQTVFRNLLSNALKFTPPGGQVNVTVQTTEADVTVAIRDTGVGMKPEVLEKLFRIDARHSTKGTANEKGTGLGLVLCQEFVRKNGGTLRVESQPGEGTVFCVVLPAATVPAPAES
ncbi:Signal transduction histidine kinase [Catalinimonas alkaloidigena]|uniref:histidine kinase n=2 Tax=Catalinimonas alkaloidigena TaxID=1075417 RepID=A0A1G9LR57_9BACT|nr:Signal transduction histidine kinase [Catalinimonas alkaloidigena]